MLDVTRLRVLVAVARHGSVTAAAHSLNYAQPSVSHHLARLEAETGTKLIQKAGRGIRLTDAGRLLAERASEIIGRLDAAENELAAYSGLRAGRLRLAAFPSALGTIVPAAAAILHTRHPSVDLRLTEAEPPEALRMLRAGYVDVALIFRHEAEGPSGTSAAGPDSTGTPAEHAGDAGKAAAPGSPDGEGLREQVLLDEPVNLIMPDGAASLSLPQIAAAVTELWPDDLARFADYRWIAGCDRCREHLLQQCAAAGYTPKISFTTDDFVAVQALVTAGLGVALLPSLALSAARNPAVRVLRLRGTRRSVVAVRYGEPPDPPATGLLMGALRAVSTSPADASSAGTPATGTPTAGTPTAAASGWPEARPVPAPAPAVLG
ncbi:MAG TPA: LysR substrate-binding domain-containing protein [Trebonia sp.]|jgi:DNA-binding transcriptional LysR family regulator|nr:LysR substrate-binding domain-containing protein [Trebonia sp.]